MEQIALHLSLLIANIAQFDFPVAWPNLLGALVNVGTWANAGCAPEVKVRALRTVKHVVRSQADKSPSINTAEREQAREGLA